MIQVSSGFKSAILNDKRQLFVKAAFFNPAGEAGMDKAELIFTGQDHIEGMKIREIVNSEENISMGSACSSELTIRLIDAPVRDDYELMVIKPEAGLMLDDGTVEMLSLGTYYVNEIKTDNDFAVLEISAYDGMYLMEKEYITNITGLPVSLEEIAGDVATIAGVALSEENDFGDYQVSFIPTCTLREMLSYIAGMLGCYARFDRNGKLVFKWYDETGYSVGQENQYINGFTKKLDKAVLVTGAISGNENESFSRGVGSNGTVINFENPFMNEIVIEDIWKNRIADMQNYSLEVVYSGQTDEESAFFATAVNGAWEADGIRELPELHIGDVLVVGESTGWENHPEKVRIDEIKENVLNLTYINGDELDNADGATAKFSRIVQWICEEKPVIEDEDGTLFEVSSVQGWANAPAYLRLSGVKESGNEMILLDINGQPLDVSQGTVCVLSYGILQGYKMSFLPAELKWRGDFSVEAGDIIEAEDKDGNYYRLPVMSQTMNFDAGLEMECICEGNSASAVNFSSSMSPMAQKVKKVYSEMQSAIKDVTEQITGQNGGTISFGFNAAGEPEELFIKCVDESSGKEGVWRWNAGGIGYSKNGMEGPFEIAMTSDGKIVGGFIAANTITGNAINIESFTKTYNAEADGENCISASHVKFEANSLEDMIKASVGSIGGKNLIINSTGITGPMDGWTVDENTVVVTEGGGEYEEKLLSGRVFILGDAENKGTLSRIVYVRKGKIHTLTFRMKKGSSDVKIFINDVEFYKSGKCEETGNPDGWTDVYYSFTPEASSVNLRIEATEGKTIIGDIMLCTGIGSTWTPAENEFTGTNVLVTEDGIIIDDIADDNSDCEIKSKLTNTGVRIVEINSSKEEKTIASYNDSGTHTRTIVSESLITVGNTKLVPIPDKNACMLIIADKTE